ncbi:DUF5946 family protein [Occallatibacter riparius]|uniref:DUF5946 family protein n=1 Tax=Occallatibacter riparius TaxID=1002689 RepID=A0A9J7BKS3_9BACT|nr:DUF5946 family protein [Occallatibacter riparius]UWZ83041.1 DUF5946 family protein [Occallatibacter riparius]
MASEEELLHELMVCTLTLGDATFVHQHVVDAWAVQHATEDSKPIAVMFGLIGLYLHLERGFNGREVQRAHMQLGTPRRTWSMPELPERRGAIRVDDVLEAVPGLDLQVMIDVWCNSVWEACEALHSQIGETCAFELGVW